MPPSTSLLLPLLQPLSPTTRKYLGLLAVSAGLYHSHRLYRIAFPYHDFPSSPSAYHSKSNMTFIGRLVNGILNFLDKDRPSTLLYERACKLSNPDQDPTKRDERTKKSLPLYAEALEICRSKNPRKHDIHADYALALYACFKRDPTRNLIDNAVAQMKEADASWLLSEKKGVHYANFQTNLGNIHLDRYLAFHDVSDLGYALKAGEEALNSCPPNAHGERVLALLLRGRAGCAQIRSMKTFSPDSPHLNQPINDLNQAIMIQLPVEDNDLIGSCHYNLAIAHNLRYKETKTPEDLSQAIEHNTQADGLLVGHPDRGQCLFNLAQTYAHKYKVEMQTKSYKDPDVAQYLTRTWEMLDRAQEIGDDAVQKQCAGLRQEIQSFARRNTTNVLSDSYRRSTSTSSSPAPPMPNMPKFEEPEAHIPDSAIGEVPPHPLRMRIDQTF